MNAEKYYFKKSNNMKHVLITVLLLHMVLATGFSQDLSRKYGKITKYELEMKSYEQDTSAVAVVLYETGYTGFDLINGQFQLYSDIKQKIKILKQDGVDMATYNLDYYDKGYGNRESISEIEAIAYNLENDKIVKSKLERKYIFEEALGKDYKRIKFSVPNVKVGSVVEIKYRKKSDLVYSIDRWMFQTHIPVVHSSYQVRIPEYFLFNVGMTGYETIDLKETVENQTFTLSVSGTTSSITCNARDLRFTAENLPAMKDESYVWCADDYLSSATFELKATNFPYEFYKPYSQTWEDLEKTLHTETDFGENLKMSNPFKAEIKQLVAGAKDNKEKVEKIYEFVKSKIRWDEKYSFWGNNARDAVKSGIGNNGQINMVLLSALKDADIPAYPVLLSRRSLGRLPYTFPSLEKLNTFVVAASIGNGKVCYLDGSTEYGGLNVLPSDFLVDRARVMCDTVSEKWVDLTGIAKNQEIMVVSATLDNNAKITSKLNRVFTGQCALDYYTDFKDAKDSATYVENFATENKLDVNAFKVGLNESLSGMVKEELEFTKQYDMAGDMIYLNPMIFTHLETNYFTQSERKLPVEFKYPYTFLLISNITIPENFEVTELPQSMKFSLNDKCRVTYIAQRSENKITLNYRFDFNQIIFANTDYQKIREYFAAIVNKNQEMLVLKVKK